MTNEDLSKLTVPALRKLAADRNVKGRSTMAKPALIEALTALRTEELRREGDKAYHAELARAVRQAARDDEAITVEALTFAPSGIDNRDVERTIVTSGVDPSAMGRIAALPDAIVTVTMAKPTGDELAKTIGRMMATFATRATARYIKGGRKHLTPRQRRRVNHKTNAYMKRAALDA